MMVRSSLSSWKCALVSYGALLACAGSVKASSPFGLSGISDSAIWGEDASIGRPSSSRRGLIEARLLWDDDISMMEDEEELMDLSIASTVDHSGSKLRQRDPLLLRMPLSFEDPLGTEEESQQRPDVNPSAEWTQQSVHDFEDRLSQRFGKNYKPQLLSTGTTIAGCCGYENGRAFVVLGADTRATAGRMVADKRCSKIHCLASNMWCCGAGTSADLDQITRHCRYSLALQSLLQKESIGNAPRSWPADEEDPDPNLETTARHSASMAAACRFFRNRLYREHGNVGANLIVGGVDEGTGLPHIRAIHPHGSMDPLPYAALGSGGLAAMAVIESRYHEKITLEEGIQIVKEAILSGIQNDMGSGSQVDLCVITTTSEQGEEYQVVSNYTRAVVSEEELPKAEEQTFTDGTTAPQHEASQKVASTPGVNGFGNYPFNILSKRVVIESRNVEEENRLKQWETVLDREGGN